MGVKLRELGPYVWEIPREDRMRVPGRVYLSREQVQALRDDPCLEQVRNVAHLPGIVGASLAMPDIHWGYGFPIGGVAAVDAEEGVITPGGIGFDINCLGSEATVLHRFGYHRCIADIVDACLSDPVSC